MQLKSIYIPLIGLILVTICIGPCSAGQDKPITSLPLPDNSMSPVSVLVISTSTPTMLPMVTEIPNPTATPTFLYPMPTLLPDCGTVQLGASGTQIIDKSENVIIQGTAILCGDIYVSPGILPQTLYVVEGMMDLDAGIFDSESADIRFYPGGGSMIFYGFMSMNDSLMKIFGLTSTSQKQPGFMDCSNISKPYEGTNDNEPEYACVITNLGNISRVKVEQYNPLGENVMSLEISFVTWKK